MRTPSAGLNEIHRAIERLSSKHYEHIAVYGDGLEERLTGLHETSSIHDFRQGIADRGASVRIPQHVAAQGHGYLEDRRPAANADPYLVSARILKTVCAASPRAETNGSAGIRVNEMQPANYGSVGRMKKGFWQTDSLSPFQQPTNRADEAFSGDFIGE
jgi:glutamine synthetase